MLLQSEQKTYLGCFFRPILRYAGCLILFCICSVALTYERDSHYYLRYGLALSTCFNWHEAHLIASGDWGMDENRTTRAEITPLRRKNKIQWHAFGHSDTRFNELWDRSRTEEDI